MMHRTRFPTTANLNPLSMMLRVYCGSGEEDNSLSIPKAFTKKLASIKHPSPIALHKKLANSKKDAYPHLSATIFPDCSPPKSILLLLVLEYCGGS